MNEKTHPVEIEGIGAFTFRHRTMRDEMRIGAEYSRLTEGVVTPSPWLSSLASMIAVLKVLAVTAPDNWDIDDMDPLEPDEYKKIITVHDALRAMEDSFRKGSKKEGEERGPGDGGDSGPVVSQGVQATA